MASDFVGDEAGGFCAKLDRKSLGGNGEETGATRLCMTETGAIRDTGPLVFGVFCSNREPPTEARVAGDFVAGETCGFCAPSTDAAAWRNPATRTFNSFGSLKL